MDRRQFGFVPKIGIEECKAEVLAEIERLRKTKKLGKHYIVFIDMTSAYDKVSHMILEQIISQKKILSPQKLQLLKYIYNKIRVTVS